MKLLFFILLLIYLTQITNILGKLGIAQNLGNITQQLSESSKDLLGWLETIALITAHELCSTLLTTGPITPPIKPDKDKMSLRFYSPSCLESRVPLSQVEKIFEITEFDVKKKVAIFANGWMSSGETEHTQDMSDAFNCRGDYNFLVLNTSGSIDTLYTWSAINTEEIGRQLAKTLEKLVKKIPLENIYLIGHSLGAHIVGYTARFFKQSTGTQLTRITGLDPANPCFNASKILPGIQHGDAAFVDIMHTNPGAFGEAYPIGDADFYVEGFKPTQPGCLQLGCSHIRAIEYLTESIYPGNENNFLAAPCSFDNIKNNECDGPKKYSMGLASSHELKGTYFLNVNSEPPYGMNNKNNNGVSNQCKKCKNK